MTHPAWSDHIIEDGPASPVAVLSLGWHEQVRAAMAREQAAYARSQHQRKQLADLQRRHEATLYERDAIRADYAYLRYAVVCVHNGEPALTRAEWGTNGTASS